MKIIGIALIVFGGLGAFISLVPPVDLAVFIISALIVFFGFKLKSRKKGRGASRIRMEKAAKKSLLDTGTPKVLPVVPVSNKDSLSPEKAVKSPDNIADDFKAYEYYNQNIAMVDFVNPDFSQIKNFDEIQFVPEPDNKYDSNALKILCNGIHVGYVYKGKTQDMIHDWLKRGDSIYALISYIDVERKEIQYTIAFYKNPFLLAQNHPSIKTKLIKTTKKIDDFWTREDSCYSLERGDQLDLDFDAETDTYLVTDSTGNEVGEISKKISDEILGYEDEYEINCLVDEVGTNDDGKCIVKVLVYFTQ